MQPIGCVIFVLAAWHCLRPVIVSLIRNVWHVHYLHSTYICCCLQLRCSTERTQCKVECAVLWLSFGKKCVNISHAHICVIILRRLNTTQKMSIHRQTADITLIERVRLCALDGVAARGLARECPTIQLNRALCSRVEGTRRPVHSIMLALQPGCLKLWTLSLDPLCVFLIKGKVACYYNLNHSSEPNISALDPPLCVRNHRFACRSIQNMQ